MKIIAHIYSSGKEVPIELDENSVIEDIKVVFEVETGVPGLAQQLIHNGRYLQDQTQMTLKQFGIKSGEKIIVANSEELQRDPQKALMLQAQMFIQYYKSNTLMLDEVLSSNRTLGEAVVNEDVGYVVNYLMAQQQTKLLKEAMKAAELQKLQENIMDPENQRKIEEMIKMERINENLEYAQEEMPESFVKVPMLYIDCAVNSFPMHAFVDTGAQNTIMSKRCAEKTELSKIMDERYKGVAIGVGKGNIVGRIHAAQLEIGGKYFPCSFTIMDSDTLNVDLILGLDNLRRHRCCIDLADNKLILMNGEVKVPFLAEHLVQESFHSEGIPPELLEESKALAKKEAKNVPTMKPPTAPAAPAAPAAPTAPKAPAASRSVPRSENEQKISRLMSEGVTREAAVAILASFGGNLEMALSYVIQQRSGF